MSQEAQGGEAWQLIEAVDGFHPSQTSNVLTAQVFWDQMMKDIPEAFGPRNPHNDEIKDIQRSQIGVKNCHEE